MFDYFHIDSVFYSERKEIKYIEEKKIKVPSLEKKKGVGSDIAWRKKKYAGIEIEIEIFVHKFHHVQFLTIYR